MVVYSGIIDIQDVDAAWIKIRAEKQIIRDIADDFTFTAPNARYDWRVKKGLWDGKIKLLNLKTQTMYSGLKDRMITWATDHNYTVNTEDIVQSLTPDQEFFDLWFTNLHGPLSASQKEESFIPRGYQRELFVDAVKQRRGTIISPTGAGKSLLIYLLTRFWGGKTLVVVPAIHLVEQLYNNFGEYSNCSRVGGETSTWVYQNVHLLYGGKDPITDKPITISTWQSIYDIVPEYFSQFDTVIIDECHLATAKSLTDIMLKCTNALHRYGFTGTTDEIQVNDLVLEGLFGPFLKNRSTDDLVQEGYLSKPKVKCIILEYSEEERQQLRELQRVAKRLDKRNSSKKKIEYDVETDYIVSHKGRHRFLVNLSLTLQGSSFILFRLIEHGKRIFTDLSKSTKCHLVYGKTDKDVREDVRVDADTDANFLTVASYGTFSTGVDVPLLRNIVFGSPYKSKIKVMQSIGRGLRRTETKDSVVIYDIVDDLSLGSDQNYGVKHFIQRMRLYAKENFDYQIVRVPIS